MNKLFLLLFLISCTSINNCPPVVNYTREEQQEVADIIEKQNNKTLNRFFIDYYNLRLQLKK